MPLYDYSCPHCSESFESLMKPYDPVICPKCGATGAVRSFPLVAGHRWACSAEGTGSSRASANQEEDRKLGKRERVTGMLERQARDL